MADEQVTKLIEMVGVMIERIVRLETQVEGLSARIDKYNNLTGRTATLEAENKSLNERVSSIVDDGKRSKISWGTVGGGIITAVIVGIIMLTINFLIK